MPTEGAYTITDLARLTGLNVRTIRYYVVQGLIGASGESGRGAHYDQGHLDRLRLIVRLRAQHLPLAEIRARLEQLGDAEVAQVLDEEGTPANPPASSALDYIRGVLGSTTQPRSPMLMRSMALPLASLPGPQAAAPATTATGPEPSAESGRSQWERLSLGANVELHIRRPLSRVEQKRVERFITIARQILKEDQP